jgi:hypothetical protein
MWTCPKCQAEVDEPFEICWSCGTSRDGVEDPGFNPEADGVMTAEDFERERQARASEPLVTVAVFDAPPEAHIARNHLEAEGIPALVVGQDSLFAEWMLRDTRGGIKLQVFENDLEAARQVLAEVNAHSVTHRHQAGEDAPEEDSGRE